MSKDTPNGSALARLALETSLRVSAEKRQHDQARLQAEKAAERAEIARAREALRALEQARTEPNSGEQGDL